MELKEPSLRISKTLVELLHKDEFLVLSFFLLKGSKDLKSITRDTGLSAIRVIKAISGLKVKDLVLGKSTQPETVELLPVAYPKEGEIICRVPEWVILGFKSRAADKQLITYYFRESGNFDGNISELAEGIGMKKRNANYCLAFLEKENIIKRHNDGQRIRLELLDRPKKGFFRALFE